MLGHALLQFLESFHAACIKAGLLHGRLSKSREVTGPAAVHGGKADLGQVVTHHCVLAEIYRCMSSHLVLCCVPKIA